jgi:predicted dehydrogenase
MKNLAIIGVGTSHATDFASLINGVGRDPIGEARVVAVFDEDSSKARQFADKYMVERVAQDPSEFAGTVDGVLVLYPSVDTAHNHIRYARPLLEQGVPTFADKPLADNYADAALVLDLAERTGTPFMSCSALRYAVELDDLVRKLGGSRELTGGAFKGPGHLVDYGIHLVEAAHTAFGPGIDHVYCESDEIRDVGLIAYKDGRKVALQVLRDTKYQFHVVLYSRDDWGQTTISDPVFYARMLAAFLEMLDKKEPAIPYDHIREVIAAVFALRLSAETGRTVGLTQLVDQPQ